MKDSCKSLPEELLCNKVPVLDEIGDVEGFERSCAVLLDISLPCHREAGDSTSGVADFAAPIFKTLAQRVCLEYWGNTRLS